MSYNSLRIKEVAEGNFGELKISLLSAGYMPKRIESKPRKDTMLG
jgi:hypothetical protein